MPIYTKTIRALATLGLLGALGTPAMAQTGVSDDRVSLPEGPGSLEGVGENAGINPNMGSMTYSVPFNVPSGYGAVTPSLGLSYNSGMGGSVVGMGWTMDVPHVERMTYRGLPEYDTEDDFGVNGSSQLVRIPGTAVYRNRYESDFIRYTWMEVGDGTEGYWLGEHPDGSRSFYGADAEGNVVDNARVSGLNGTFRYMLVEKVDVYNHAMRFTYIKDGAVSLLSHIGYVFVDGETPTYAITLTYEERRDTTRADFLSDAKAGFHELLTQRLQQVNVLSRGQVMRSYQLSYEPYSSSDGFTRLNRVETLGSNGGAYPIRFDFEYSQGLGQQRPEMNTMGSLGVNMASGRATLIDINGDGLPDMLDTTNNDAHRFFINTFNATENTSAFNTTPTFSVDGTGSAFRLGSPGVQVLDANGDGFADLLNAGTGEILMNLGGGDWAMSTDQAGTTNLAAALAGDFDAEDGELQTLKFVDYNNDKKIDLMRSTQDTTTVFRNMGEEGFTTDEGVEAIGIGFAEDGAQFADMNGDGLLDVVRVQPQTLRYRLNYGWGVWGPWVEINNLPISEAQVDLSELEDINGDGLADLVLVTGNTVTFALNTNTTSFADQRTLSSDDVEGEIPLRDSSVTVLYADMNANGSSDIVWVNGNGQVDYLELFPVRPNLLTKITNNIGQVEEITYSTSVAQMAKDREAGVIWRYKLPHPMLVVSSVNRTDNLTQRDTVDVYTYHDGYYDGIEKQFRGYERVEVRDIGDDTQEERLIERLYEVGIEDSYRKNLELHRITSSAGSPLATVEMIFEDCPVDDVPDNTEFAVRYVCQTNTRTTFKEGQQEADWRTTESRVEYDGYGNVVLSMEVGVVGTGADGTGPCPACEADRDDDDFGNPCGAQCLGDEMYSETSYIPPGETTTSGRWILGSAWRERAWGHDSSDLISETVTYYDGEPFTGMSQGTLEKGDATRVTIKRDVGSSYVIEAARSAYDDHGNVIDFLDPLGSPGGNTHRRQYTYDSEHLRVVRAEVLLEDKEGEPYALRRDVLYEPLFDKMSDATAWIRTVNGEVVSTRRASSFVYDEFGRMLQRFEPGNTSADPDFEFTYDLGDPVSRIITRTRTEVGEAPNLETVQCFDGRGRTYQRRTRLNAGMYQVDGLTLYNVRSEPVRVYQPYMSNSAQCDTVAPEGTLFVDTRYDGIGRPIETTQPDGDIYGGQPSVSRASYLPFATLVHDHEDNDPTSPHADTPIITRTDGMGRTVAIERYLEQGGAPATVTMRYDGLGRLTETRDAEGNLKTQAYDLLGRVTQLSDPNSTGDTHYVYDDASNVVQKTDGRGLVSVNEYDGMNRPLTTYHDADPDGTRIAWTYDVDPGCDPLSCTNTAGHLASISYPGPKGIRAEERVGYDLRDRMIYKSQQIAGHTFDFAFDWDNANRLKTTTYPGGRVVENLYDDATRLEAIPGIIDAVSYDDRGLLADIRCADGVTTTMAYDDVMRTIRTETKRGNDLLQGFAYGYDRVHNRETIEDLVAEAPSFANNFDYDAWYRVIEANLGQNGDHSETVGYTFDTIDNITSRSSNAGAESTAFVGDFVYEGAGPNALTEAAVRYTYDADGNVINRGDQTMVWDWRGHLVRVEGGLDGDTELFYGEDQSRIARIDALGEVLYVSKGEFEVRDGISTLYIRANDRRIARVEDDRLATTILGDPVADAQVNAADAFSARDSDDADAFVRASVRRMLIENGPDDGVTFLHGDHLDNITLATGVIDDAATVLGHRAFDMLGNVRPDSWGYVDAYGFTGQELDHSTGLIHFDWRYYDPSVGRWLSIDPAFAVATPGGLADFQGDSTAAYAYIAGRFANTNDPTGLHPPGSKSGKGGKSKNTQTQTSNASTKNKNKNKSGKSQKPQQTTQNTNSSGGGGTTMTLANASLHIANKGKSISPKELKKVHTKEMAQMPKGPTSRDKKTTLSTAITPRTDPRIRRIAELANKAKNRPVNNNNNNNNNNLAITITTKPPKKTQPQTTVLSKPKPGANLGAWMGAINAAQANSASGGAF